MVSSFDDPVASSVKNKKCTICAEAIIVGVASVALGSIALGDGWASFHTTNEGWFEKNSKYAGMDKLGHAWYGSTIADYFYERIPNKTTEIKKSAALASAVSMGIMTLIEISDGFADTEVGFSHEDMVANSLGVGFSYLRNTHPSLKQLVDYRTEYLPNHSASDWSMGTFYADQKYLLAWKLSGFDALKDNPLRFFEIHTGYYARGYSSREFRDEKMRHSFIGLGLNLSELLGLGAREKSRSKRLYNHIFEHIQIPKTSLEVIEL